MEILYQDAEILVCLKPPRVLSTDEPGGLPELLRAALGDGKADLRTVHRLDRAVGGLMLLARNAAAASALSRQLREGGFHKEYLAVAHGETEDAAALRDLLIRDRARKMSFVTDAPGRGVQEARLRYETLGRAEGMSLVRIELETGRTHQIRVHMRHIGHPIYGDAVYGKAEKTIAGQCLHAKTIGFVHPVTGEFMQFDSELPAYFRDAMRRCGVLCAAQDETE